MKSPYILSIELGMIGLKIKRREFIMKKLGLLIALLPLSVFAGEKVNPNSYLNNNCQSITDPEERKDCLSIAARNEAQENFKNFEENTPSSYQDNF
ncbi:MAG: hypothetical protein ACRCXC_10675 [Legionella sp.]